jgi:hypothetical protein
LRATRASGNPPPRPSGKSATARHEAVEAEARARLEAWLGDLVRRAGGAPAIDFAQASLVQSPAWCAARSFAADSPQKQRQNGRN